MDRQKPSIFTYIDYRRYIKEYIEARKRIDSKYSYRYFSAKSGFSSSNFLSLVVKGKRNLTSASIAKVARGIGLNKQERTFFENLVFMNQSATHEDKDLYFQRMLKSKPFRDNQQINIDQYGYFSNWYNPVIREMVKFAPKPLDFEWIAERIQPPITTRQVKIAIHLLLNLGLIEQYPNGDYGTKEAVLTTGSEVNSFQITKFHKQMAELADSAIDRFPSDQRDISGLVLSMRCDRMPLIKEKIEAFRNELAEMAAADENEDAVFYIQLRAFPLTKLQEKK